MLEHHPNPALTDFRGVFGGCLFRHEDPKFLKKWGLRQSRHSSGQQISLLGVRQKRKQQAHSTSFNIPFHVRGLTAMFKLRSAGAENPMKTVL